MSGGARQAALSALRLGGIAVLAVALLAGVHHLARGPIAEAERQAALQALALVMPADRYDNDLLADRVQVRAPAWLGLDAASVHRARLAGRANGLVLEANAPDGYAGDIRLLVGVDAEGRVLGVRVTEHRETPGLGDGVEPRRSNWIARFAGRSLGDPPADRWAVRRDGGDFDQFAGATVTPRAVVNAVRRTLQFVRRHGPALMAAESGATLRFDDAPEPGTGTERDTR
ncbi:electron transport complex subunit RsxG [Arenimonas fontis]|uniref:Ion-translocating oxidoreductase complex subunit G n=1 Tax=Arenimonas fontis TaxID=2608255 RepID=A0A5B2ZCJ5_9GAMM|nr:electron transport complex subunit RsxG [Arenimonas fontis]KAA2285717.1 electron transport complex subunit RsxG [Arenimonas fontis]